MNGKCFIDTNVVVYAYDASEKVKHYKAFNLLEQLGISQTGVVSLQVLSEFYVVVTRKIERPISTSQARGIIEEFKTNWEIYEPSTSTLLLAMDITEEYKLNFWDSLIVAAAKESKAVTVYSEDFQHNQTIEGLKFINPFSEDIKPKTK